MTVDVLVRISRVCLNTVGLVGWRYYCYGGHIYIRVNDDLSGYGGQYDSYVGC